MLIFTSSEFFYMTICFMFIVCAVTCGVIRLGHMCHPFDRDADYFYPARYGIAAMYFGVALWLPYVLQVHDADTWLYARSVGILYYPVIFGWLILRYFNRAMYHRKVHYAMLIMPTLLLIVALLLGCTSLYHPSAIRHVLYYIGIFGFAMTIYLSLVLYWLKRRINYYHHELFSNPVDFPYQFAQRVLLLPVVVMTTMWIVFFTGSRDVKMCFDVVMTLLCVAFLCVILHPQRQPLNEEQTLTLDSTEDTEEERVKSNFLEGEELTNLTMPESNSSSQPVDEQLAHYQELVLEELRDRRAFLDSHYTLAKLSQSIGLGRTYTSRLCTSLGGFYYLVNKYRCEYAEQYIKAHPNVTLDTVALESGFNDRRSYNRAKASVSDKDDNL